MGRMVFVERAVGTFRWYSLLVVVSRFLAVQMTVGQRPHPLQHSASTVTGVAGARRESREARRSISIPVIGDNRSGGKINSLLYKYNKLLTY